MAKNDMDYPKGSRSVDEIREEEREVETEAAFAGEGPEGDDNDHMMLMPKKLDDEAFVERIVGEADAAGASGPGIEA